MRKLLSVTAAACAALLIAAPVAADEEEDQAIADEVVAETADNVPDRWEEEPPADETDEVEPPECEELTRTVEKAEEGPFAEIKYGDPTDPIGFTEVRAGAYIFPKAKLAKRFAKVLTSDESLACQGTFGQLFGVTAQADVEEIELNSAAGFRVTVEVEGGVFVLEGVRARVERGVVTVSAFSANGPLPFIEDLMAALEATLREAV